MMVYSAGAQHTAHCVAEEQDPELDPIHGETCLDAEMRPYRWKCGGYELIADEQENLNHPSTCSHLFVRVQSNLWIHIAFIEVFIHTKVASSPP